MFKFYALTTFLVLSVNVWSISYPQINYTSPTGGSVQGVNNTPTLGYIDVPDGSMCPICLTGTVTGGVCDNPDCPSNKTNEPVGGEMPLGNDIILLMIPLSIYTIIKLKKRNILSV